jgi:hypothetical protein
MHGQGEKYIYGFGGELQMNRPLERFTCRLEGMFKMNLEKTRWKATDGFILLWGRTGDRLCELGSEPIGSIKWE